MEEADACKRRQRSLEDELLEIMELAEPVAAQLTGLAEQQEDLQSRRAAAKERVDAAEAEIVGEVASVESQRTSEASALSAQVLAEYDRLRSRMDGVAVSELIGTTCTGCHTTLAAMECERIRREPPDAIVYCEPCGRIVVRH